MRHFSQVSALTLLASGLASASPVPQQSDAPVIDDGVILNYALTLEYLERAFYRDGLANYTQEEFVAAGFKDPFYSNLKQIAKDEVVHVDFLVAGLEQAGIISTVELEYCFPSTDPMSFVTLSSVLEGVGVSAYIGAAASIVNKDYLTAAGTILGVEARHASYIRASLGQVPFPNSFETPLDFNSVFSLAAPFICGGTSPVTLPFKAFPALTVKSCGPKLKAGSSSIALIDGLKNAMAFDAAITADTPLYAVFFSGLDKIPVQVRVPHESDDYFVEKIPEVVSGQVYVLLSRSDKDFSDANIVAGPAIIEVEKKMEMEMEDSSKKSY